MAMVGPSDPLLVGQGAEQVAKRKWLQHSTFFDDVQKMWPSWKTHCATNNFTDSSWGTGASSHDQMCWSFLSEKFKKDSRY